MLGQLLIREGDKLLVIKGRGCLWLVFSLVGGRKAVNVSLSHLQ